MAGVGCNAYTCTSREGLVLSALLGVPVAQLQESGD